MLNISDAREQLKGRLKDYVEQITPKSKGTNMYVCPICGSGTRSHKTGAFSIKDEKWKCFSCKKGGDIFDLIGEFERITDHVEQVQRASEIFGIITADVVPGNQNHPKIEQNTQNNEKDYTSFFLSANQNIGKTNYRRGISLEILNRFQIGFVENWKHPKRPNFPGSPRLIIPTSKYSYLARDVRNDSDIPETEKSFAKIKVGNLHFFNIEALETATKPIFVVEGELDALSIIEVGGEAIALGTASTVNAFIKLVTTKKPVQQLIVAMDNDQAGEKAAEKLLQGLKENKVSVCKYNPYGEYKDANEALQNDRESLSQAISEVECIQDAAEQVQKEAYLKSSADNYMQEFIEDIANSLNKPLISTGFTRLDKVLDGGLYEGLYILGAISSLGKTTLMLQITDQIAQTGTDVLMFALEMARKALVARSVSRLTYQQTDGDITIAKTTRGITTGQRYATYNPAEKDLINSCISAYTKFAKNIYINEGIESVGVEQIRETIRKHILYTGKNPVVVIDYLQILAPRNTRATDKQNMDNVVTELKRISRDFKIPVIGISSLNRMSYNAPIAMEAFKESGALEYGSDVLIGLQFRGVGDPNFSVNDAKTQFPREVELVILKNRDGATGNKIDFSYYAAFNFFKEGKDPWAIEKI